MSHKPWDLRSTAHHEAGHAVVAMRLGILLVGPCTIVPDHANNAAGSVHTDGPGNPAFDEDHAAVLYAGRAAELLHDPDAPTWHATSDYDSAAELVPEPHRQRDVQKRADELVQKDRAAIEAVAEALLEFGTLPGDSVQVVVDAVDEGEEWRPALVQYRELQSLPAE